MQRSGCVGCEGGQDLGREVVEIAWTCRSCLRVEVSGRKGIVRSRRLSCQHHAGEHLWNARRQITVPHWGTRHARGWNVGLGGSRRRQVTGRNLFKTTCEEQVFRKYEYCSATSTPFLWGSGSGTYPENRHDFVKAERAAIMRIYFNLAFRTGAS